MIYCCYLCPKECATLNEYTDHLRHRHALIEPCTLRFQPTKLYDSTAKSSMTLSLSAQLVMLCCLVTVTLMKLML